MGSRAFVLPVPLHAVSLGVRRSSHLFFADRVDARRTPSRKPPTATRGPGRRDETAPPVSEHPRTNTSEVGWTARHISAGGEGRHTTTRHPLGVRAIGRTIRSRRETRTLSSDTTRPGVPLTPHKHSSDRFELPFRLRGTPPNVHPTPSAPPAPPATMLPSPPSARSSRSHPTHRPVALPVSSESRGAYFVPTAAGASVDWIGVGSSKHCDTGDDTAWDNVRCTMEVRQAHISNKHAEATCDRHSYESDLCGSVRLA